MYTSGVVRILATGLVVLGLVGCGGSKHSAGREDVVVRVGDTVITKSVLEHWIAVEAVLTYELIPRAPVPAGVTSQPPDFTTCINYLENLAEKRIAGATETPEELKRDCRARYEHIWKHMLTILITYAWLSKEGKAHGIQITNQEVQGELARIKSQNFKSAAEFQRFLHYTNLTLADELLRVRMNIISTRLYQKVTTEAGGGKAGGAAFARFVAALSKRRAAETSCGRGYVVANCQQYRGDEPPAAEL
jgi:hypothetical protein